MPLFYNITISYVSCSVRRSQKINKIYIRITLECEIQLGCPSFHLSQFGEKMEVASISIFILEKKVRASTSHHIGYARWLVCCCDQASIPQHWRRSATAFETNSYGKQESLCLSSHFFLRVLSFRKKCRRLNHVCMLHVSEQPYTMMSTLLLLSAAALMLTATGASRDDGEEFYYYSSTGSDDVRSSIISNMLFGEECAINSDCLDTNYCDGLSLKCDGCLSSLECDEGFECIVDFRDDGGKHFLFFLSRLELSHDWNVFTIKHCIRVP